MDVRHDQMKALVNRMSRRRLLVGTGAAAMLTATARGPLAALAQAPAATPTVPTIPNLAGQVPLPLTGARRASFEAYVADKLDELGVQGAAVAVVQDGAVVFLQGFGVRAQGRPEAVTADTLLRIGSITKSFSSLLAATLVDAGQVRWDTPLVALLPDFAVANPALTPRLTIRDAFSAATGLPRRDWELIFNVPTLTSERMIATIRELPLTAPYGTKYQYNNQMVAAGGFAAAVADGGSPNALDDAYTIALRERVLNPLGMARTTLTLGDVLADGDYVVPHAPDITGLLHPLPLLEDDTWVIPVAPTGGLWASAREMARYVQTELARGIAPDGGRVVSAANLAETWRPGVAMPASPPGTPPALATYGQHYGLGWVIGSYFGQRVINHSGGTLGFASLLTFLPEANLGVVVLTNTSAGSLFLSAVTFRLLELLFAQPATIDAVVAAGQAAVAQGRTDLVAQLGHVDPAAVTPYLGRYTNPALGEATLALQGGQLIFAAGNLRSALRPARAAGAVTGYLPVDPPLASVPPQLTVSLRERAGQPHLVLTATGDPGAADLVYPYVPAGPAATPAS